MASILSCAHRRVRAVAVVRRLLPLAAVLGLATGAQAQVFRTAPDFPAGVHPLALVAADLDRDGILDLAVANGSSDLSLLMGDGHGGFATRAGPAGPAGPSSLAAADFDRDGWIDLAVGGLTGAVILRGDGAGGFASPVPCGRGGRIAAVDVDADGSPDLVGAAGHQAWVARGDGTGACGPAIAYDAGLDLSAVASVDLDGDLRPELLLTDRATHAVIMLPNLGDGRFGSPTIIPVGSGTYPADLLAADLDRDGRADLAVAAPGTDEVLRLAGDGHGGLAVAQRVSLGAQAATLALADLDDDGRPDLVVADANASDVLVLTGTGGGWTAPARGHGVGHGPIGLAVGDFDHDGRTDVAVANRGGPTGDGGVSILRGDGEGGFPDAAPSLLVDRHPVALAAADLDGDGRLDLASANQVSGSLSLLRGTTAGFAAALPLAVAADARSVAVADFDGDGWPDLAATHFDGSAMSLLRATGAGAFASPVSFGAGDDPVALTTADFDGDGAQDAAVVGWGADAVAILRGDGRGGFLRTGDHAVGHEPRAIVSADFDRDGQADLAVANWGSASVSILKGDGRGGFAAAVSLPAGAQTSALAAGDVDGDGLLDLVAANERLWEPSGSVSFWRGDGAGGFAAPAAFAVGRGCYAVALADLDLDGRLDVATANAFDQTVTVLASAVGGRLVRRADLPVGFAPTALVARDLDGDGRADLAVTSTPAGRGRVRVLRNETPAADLAVAVDDGATQAWPGRSVSYAITVTNRGPLDVAAVTLVSRPAAGLGGVAYAASVGSYDPASGAWTGLDLRAGTEAVLTLTGTLDAMAVGALVQVASVAGPSGLAEPTPGDNAARDVDAVTPAADVALEATATPDPVSLGEVLAYDVRIRNRGPLAAAAGELAVEVPTALTFLPGAVGPDACTAAAGRLSCPVPALEAGAVARLELRMRANRELRATTRISVGSATFDPDPRNDVVVVTTGIRPGFGRELVHGFLDRTESRTGSDWYRLVQEPRASYEVVVDEAPLLALRLELLGSDLRSTIALAPHAAGVRSLRVQNPGPTAVDWQAVHVAAGGSYRVRAYETTGAFPRFDDRGDARTIVVLQNAGVERVQGTLWFWDPAGALLAARPFELPPRGVGTFDVAQSVPEQAGSMTVTHDAHHGELVGKSATFDPTTGIVSEGVMAVRPR